MILPQLFLLQVALTASSVLELDLTRNKHSRHQKRGDYADETLHNHIMNYIVKFELGTPPQRMEVLLDTSTSDFYVLSSRSDVCQMGICKPENIYKNEDSSTFHNNKTTYRSTFADGTSAEGQWAQDVVKIGGHTIDNFNFAIAKSSSINRTIGGIGLPASESPYFFKQSDHTYANLPIQLKQTGAISHVSYSLWLNSWGNSEGSILFGGVDLSRNSTEIYKFPLVPSLSGELNTFNIKLDGIYLAESSGKQQVLADTSIAVTFDTGAGISRLPSALLEPLFNALGGKSFGNLILVPCENLSNGGGIGLLFSGIEYLFGFHDISLPSRTNPGYCIPGFIPNDNAYVIGDNILRSLYVVYDLEGMELGIALAETQVERAFEHTYLPLSDSIPGVLCPGYYNSAANFLYDTFSATLKQYHPKAERNSEPSDLSVSQTKPPRTAESAYIPLERDGDTGDYYTTVSKIFGQVTQRGLVMPYKPASAILEKSMNWTGSTSIPTTTNKNSSLSLKGCLRFKLVSYILACMITILFA